MLRHLRGGLVRGIAETDEQGRFFESDPVGAAKGATRLGSDPNAGMIPKVKTK